MRAPRLRRPRSPAVMLVATALLLVVTAIAVACGGGAGGEAGEGEASPPAATATATASPGAAATATATATPVTATPAPPLDEDDLEIVTLLPPDAIPAINNPRIVSAEVAAEQLGPTDLVIGVSIEGEHRAYGAAFLSGHEIVNDMLGGRAIAVTW